MDKIIPMLPERSRQRMERLFEAVCDAWHDVTKLPCHEGRLHPGFVTLGKVIYDATKRDWTPSEIPAALRAVPWIFVLSQLARTYPNINFNQRDSARAVELYLDSLASGGAGQNDVYRMPLLQDARRKIEGV